jgi:hypothetical protein
VVAAAVGLAVVSGLVYTGAQLRRHYLKQQPAFPLHQRPLVTHEPTQVLANDHSPLAALEERRTRMEQRLVGDDHARVLNPPRSQDLSGAGECALITNRRLPRTMCSSIS